MAAKQYIDLTVKNLPLPILLLSAEEDEIKIVSVNIAYLELTNTPHSNFIDRPFYDLFQNGDDAELLTAMKNLVAKVLATGKGHKIEQGARTRQISDSIYKNAEIVPFVDDEGIIEILICSLNQVDLSDKDIGLLLDNSEESIIQVGRDLEILNYNLKLKESFKTYFNKDVYKGDSILNYALPGHAEMLKNIYEKVFAGEQIDYEIEIEQGNELVTKRIRYKPIYTSGERVSSVVVTSVDITQEKKTLAENEFERRDKGALINSTEDLIWSVSKSLKLVAANDAFVGNLLEITGMEIRQGDDVLMGDYFSEEFCNYWRELYLRALSGERFNVATSNIRKGAQLWFETSFNPIYKEEVVVGIACFSKNITEAKNAQQLLIQTNKRLKAAQKLAKLGYWEADLVTGKLYWSDEVYAIWQVDADGFELTVDSLSKTVHPDDLAEFNWQRETSVANRQGFSFEHRIVLKDGSIRWVHETGNIVLNNGAVTGFEGTVQDITETKLVEQALHESNERYKYATRATHDAVWDWDLVKDNIYWGEGFEQIFGHKSSSFSAGSSSWTEYIHASDKVRVLAGIYEVITGTGTAWTDEYWYKKANGEYAYVQDRGIVLRDEKGKSLRMVGAMHDLTQQKKEEERLRLLESVIMHSNDAIVITEAGSIDKPGPRIIFVNEAFVDMTGYPADEITGQTPRILQGAKTERKQLDRLRNALEHKKTCQVEIINYKKDGQEFWNHISLVPITDAKGQLTHWIAIQRDVTDRRNYVEMLERQNQALREISWTQSHVVRAPLARLMGLVNIMELDPHNEEGRRELMGYISDSAAELDEIIKSIISKAREIDPPQRSDG